MFDLNDNLDDFLASLDYLVAEMPKESRMVLRRVGSQGRTIVARKARQLVDKKTGNYHKGFKRGKVWQDEDGTYKVRVYNNQPHAHLIEDGHRIVDKNGVEKGFQPGKKVVQKANKELEDVWLELLVEQLNNLIKKM